ncbi:hypothetical protein [Streptomyces sp. 6N223]|uniref:hypothetical protein n=1 Tax=Streptomyces sp. 6N223 TaxID=3457412 RepID=UPI003FD6A988
MPDQIKLTMLHQMEHKHEPGLSRTKIRETSYVVRRPDHGEARVAVRCGHCGREGMFIIQDLGTTKRLRRGPVIRSLVSAVALLTGIVSLWITGLAGESALFLMLAFVASLVLGPVGIYLVCDPSSNIGVQAPELVHFDSTTRRQGLSYVTRSSRRGEGVACSGYAKPAR